jgi:hypothetical protein
MQVEERSASVMIQMRVSSVSRYADKMRVLWIAARSFSARSAAARSPQSADWWRPSRVCACCSLRSSASSAPGVREWLLHGTGTVPFDDFGSYRGKKPQRNEADNQGRGGAGQAEDGANNRGANQDPNAPVESFGVVHVIVAAVLNI